MRVGLWSGDNLDVDDAQLMKQLMQMNLLSHTGQDEMISQDSFSYGDTTISSLDTHLVHNSIQNG
jgi:hypothetical protein